MRPPAEKTTQTLEIFTIKQPVEEIEIKHPDGRKEKQWRFAYFHFTTCDRPVTFNGVQYIPLSCFDQVKWDEVVQT